MMKWMTTEVWKTAAAAHHGGLHPLLHELLDSRPDGGGGVEQHLVEEAGSDSLDLPERSSSPPPPSSVKQLLTEPLTSALSGHSSLPPPPSPWHSIPTRPPETGRYEESDQHINSLSTLVIMTVHLLLKYSLHRIPPTAARVLAVRVSHG